MQRRFGTALLAVAWLAGGCGGGGADRPGPGGGGNSFTATIDGRPWAASPSAIAVTSSGSATRQGTLVLFGIETSTSVSLSLTLSFIVGPATQPLGANPGTSPGGIGAVIAAAESWITPLDGASGFVTITARTAERIAGTFHFTAEATIGTAPPTISVTDGAFDITVPAGLPPLPTGVGSTAIANLGGTPWNAATIVGTRSGPGVFGLTASNTAYTVTLVPIVPVSAGNTYGIPSQMSMTVIRSGTGDSWSGGTGADVGSVTIGTFETDRLVATFAAALPPLNAASPLAVTGGAVNAYLEQ